MEMLFLMAACAWAAATEIDPDHGSMHPRLPPLERHSVREHLSLLKHDSRAARMRTTLLETNSNIYTQKVYGLNCQLSYFEF